MEDLEDKITEEQQRKKQAEEKLQAQNKLLIGIREGLDHITEKLFLGEATGVPQTRNSVELLAVCTDKMSKLMTRLSGINIFMKKLEMEEDQFTPVGLELPKVRSGKSIVARPLLNTYVILYLHRLFLICVNLFCYKVEVTAEDEGEVKGKAKEDVESGPEEEEVPTRGFLKRQANMIVDAKSRSKRGNRRK